MTNAHLPAALGQWLAQIHGVATTADLRRFGVGRVAQERLVDAGVIAHVTRGVFVSATAAPTLEHRCRLLSCLHPEGFVTGPTAGSLGGLRRQPLAELNFSTLHGRRLDPLPGVRFRQTTVIGPADRHARPDGIVVASWCRLAFDLAADLRQLDHQSVVHQLLDRRLVTLGELDAIARRLCHPARPGSTTFRTTLAAVTGVTPQDSHPEVELRDALLAAGVPVEAQVAVPSPTGGPPFHVDLGVPAARWGIELDIHPEHRSVEGHQRDAHRVRTLHGIDWQIEPVAELDMRPLEPLVSSLVRLYRRRTADIGGPEADPGRPPNLRCGSGLG